MLLNRKEKRLKGLLEEHFGLVGVALDCFRALLEEYPSGGDYEACGHRIHQAENRADAVRDEILASLYRGAFMPTNREDFVVLAQLVDSIANQAQKTGNLLILTRPAIPVWLKDGLCRLLDLSIETFGALRRVLEAANSDLNRVGELVAAVSSLESRVDGQEWDLIKQTAEADLELARKRDLREIIQDISRVADICEDAAGRFNLMLIKQTF
ncbi:MAG TPA: DUF47 family protein [bacterium]|nr:DUF47 family protein [bacterium]HPJ72553.1 DUF47 family protein [bacterium]HPQ67454.1 DUF47 family protein [bacterium]